MNALYSAFGAGLLFGIGLWVSGMANPEKVLGFLDITGDWDASLMLVMGGAVAVTAISFRIILKRQKPLLEKSFELPQKSSIDLPLVAGAAIFGIGWGIAGYCPGPALTALATLSTESMVFVTAMVAGGLLHKAVTKA
ncbi:MAG: YeeE/YedE family protein [Candidatus Parcubacteria bacterium]|nr:YeeE/YedE family protein [Burkholderiales bacterium]